MRNEEEKQLKIKSKGTWRRGEKSPSYGILFLAFARKVGHQYIDVACASRSCNLRLHPLCIPSLSALMIMAALTATNAFASDFCPHFEAKIHILHLDFDNKCIPDCHFKSILYQKMAMAHLHHIPVEAGLTFHCYYGCIAHIHVASLSFFLSFSSPQFNVIFRYCV